MPVAATQFFNYIEPFVDYRQTIYEASDETVRTNRIDLKLFEDFAKERNAETIDGPMVMDFQRYLKKERKNSGPSINRKIFTLRSYSHYLHPVRYLSNNRFRFKLRIQFKANLSVVSIYLTG